MEGIIGSQRAWRIAAGSKLRGKKHGGEGGIRTREKIAPLHDFQSCPFGRSGTSPAWRESPVHRTRIHRAAGNPGTSVIIGNRPLGCPQAQESISDNSSWLLPFKFARILAYNIDQTKTA